MQPKVPNMNDKHAHAPTAVGRSAHAHANGAGARWPRPELAKAEDLVIAVLNCLLENHALDPYWFCLNQGDLSAEDLLRDRRVALSVVHEVTRLVSRGMNK